MTEALKLAAVGLCAFFAVFWWRDNGRIPRMGNAVRGYTELQNSLPCIRGWGGVVEAHIHVRGGGGSVVDKHMLVQHL